MEQIRPVYLNEKIETVKKDDFLKYRSGDLPTWCSGCGYFGIIDAWYKACRELELKHEEVVTVSGIGCSGRTPIFLNSYGFHKLHGRSIPVASGLKLAREDPYGVGIIFQDKARPHYQDILRSLNKED